MEKHTVKVLFTEEEVKQQIRRVADEINRDYAGRSLHLIGILKGSVPFLNDLAQCLTVPVTMDFMSCSSYGGGTKSTGVVRLNKDLDEPIMDRDVLVVEDIIDTANTLTYLKGMLESRHPASLRFATLLDKPSGRKKPFRADYAAFQCPDCFIVGYGLDYDQIYRNLPYIGYVEFEQ